MRRFREIGRRAGLAGLLGAACWAWLAPAASAGEGAGAEQAMRGLLDAPLLFVKRHNDLGIHIYDTYYKWRPGGGIYVIENPSAPPAEQKVRAVIDATTPGTLGAGVYSEPDLAWDGKRMLFCYKGEAAGSTSIWEIGIDGTGLRRVTDPSACACDYKGSLGGEHDIAPAYLADGRIIFTSTRPNGLVPCFNTGVDILHVMNADGSDIRPISVNNVNEFDPCMMPDGRILFGRWEYIDKTALTQQSLWTVFPDGTMETALFANNMAVPEAVLDARPVPGSERLVVGTFTPHNAPPRGSIAMVDPYLGKNDPGAIFNFEHPDKPTYDRGESCEPWPLSAEVVVYSGRPEGQEKNAILMIDRSGRRVVVRGDAEIDLHSPMPVKARARPPVCSAGTTAGQAAGRFFVQDVYDGLDGVGRGEVKWLRVIEETSRTSGTPGGAYNQTFLMSAALAWSAKDFMGIVPVEADGSAYFEVASGRAVYLQALDGEGRLVRSMRTFVQAAPGVTRSCIGCHEHKYSAPANRGERAALRREPARLRPESWGSGFVDYPSMVQPVFDKHCVGCHGGEKGFGGGIDLSGGWTEHFSISYETLVSRLETQVTASRIAGIDCMNGTSLWSAQIFPARSHGSGAAPLAEVLVSGHKGRIGDLTRPERDLVLAWIDTNGLFHGTWDSSPSGCSVRTWGEVKGALAAEMAAAGCGRCHGDGNRIVAFENDWFNLERPASSRILRAPLAAGEKGWGLALCRDRKVDPKRERIRLMRTGGYLHAVTPLEAFKPEAPPPPPEEEGEAVASFASTEDAHYQAMLAIISDGRRAALAQPRVDMPGATVTAGSWRQLVPTPLPEALPALKAEVDADCVVHVAWERSTRTLGLSAEVHRGARADFAPSEETLLAKTSLFEHADVEAPEGTQAYALILVSGEERSEPIRANVTVPPPRPPEAPRELKATAAPGRVDLRWNEVGGGGVRYQVYRAKAGSDAFERVTGEPTPEVQYSDVPPDAGVARAYMVKAVSKRGVESGASATVSAAALPEVKEPVLAAAFAENGDAALVGGAAAKGTVHGKARVAEGVLDLREGGHVTFENRPEFHLNQRISVACWVRFAEAGQMPVVVSCGLWQQGGWFLQRLGDAWRWHVGGVDCDGGKPAVGRWIHLVGTFDGRTVRLFEDGAPAAERTGGVNRAPWKAPLHVGQYSGGAAPSFQVEGWISGVQIYNRILSPEEIKAASQSPPAKP